MELWIVLVIGAVIFAWCAVQGFIQTKYLASMSAPKASGITLVMLFAGWGVVTTLAVSNANHLWHWIATTAVYLIAFMTTFCNAESWGRSINRFLPYE